MSCKNESGTKRYDIKIKKGKIYGIKMKKCKRYGIKIKKA